MASPLSAVHQVTTATAMLQGDADLPSYWQQIVLHYTMAKG
jgi:hypothetical protein